MQSRLKKTIRILRFGSWTTTTTKPCLQCSRKLMVLFYTCVNLCSILKRLFLFSAKERVVGWYSTGPKLRESDLDIQELFFEYRFSWFLQKIDFNRKGLWICTNTCPLSFQLRLKSCSCHHWCKAKSIGNSNWSLLRCGRSQRSTNKNKQKLNFSNFTGFRFFPGIYSSCDSLKFLICWGFSTFCFPVIFVTF